MIEISIPKTIDNSGPISVEAKSLSEALSKMNEDKPELVNKLATFKNQRMTLKPFITLFVNDVMTIETNPSVADGDKLTFEMAISGG
ncbi:hypothetical protein PUG46_06725 [Erwiniaceae bacterium L1_55_4]|nr:hypothetical protein [Erwiniaceae bacterium L1_55_4]